MARAQDERLSGNYYPSAGLQLAHLLGAVYSDSDVAACGDVPAIPGGARRRRPPTASRLKGPRKQKSFAYKLLKRGLAKSFAYKLLKRGLANLMSPTSTSGVAPPLKSSNGYSRQYDLPRVFALAEPVRAACAGAGGDRVAVTNDRL
ncbi:hypothetical protein EVAR_33759_1 [Eumeta japonica]|uniref:Uncharacterized protein n=1 Tax=Eumeta variegata TaxID=151549 RepID=A0A4C1VVS9_EUMVA|nr:hypothetical protein EVAR_33759_1 [Eumeta japonica]